MVSTRGGVKGKFAENERVLCYEPDPTKAKVLYDSKVLHVVDGKDPRGRKSIEYLIHFQGWNSSWDRYVSEEYVLKDTPENRQLQKDLAEKAQLQLGAYLYRRERKKHSRKSHETAAPSSDEGSSGSPPRMDTDDGGGGGCRGASSSSEDDDGDSSAAEEDAIPVQLTPELRDCLERDHCCVQTAGRLHRLPADPTVVGILEGYWRHYATNQLCGLGDKFGGGGATGGGAKVRPPSFFGQQPKPTRPKDVQKNLTICREVLDGLRIYFDFTLKDLLLYQPEKNQVPTAQARYTSLSEIKKENVMSNNRHDFDPTDCANNSGVTDEEHSESENKPTNRKRTLRSSKSADVQVNGNAHPSAMEVPVCPKPCSSIASNSSDVSSSIAKALSWRLLPDHVHAQQPPPPCLVYGATHLARLFVQLPELLNLSNIDDAKLKILLQHFESLLDFLTEHKEWFGERVYADATELK